MDEEISNLAKDAANRVIGSPTSNWEREFKASFEENFKIGFKQGFEEGIKISRNKIVLNMVKMEISHDTIAEIAEIELEEVKQIIANGEQTRANKKKTS